MNFRATLVIIFLAISPCVLSTGKGGGSSFGGGSFGRGRGRHPLVAAGGQLKVADCRPVFHEAVHVRNVIEQVIYGRE